MTANWIVLHPQSLRRRVGNRPELCWDRFLVGAQGISRGTEQVLVSPGSLGGAGVCVDSPRGMGYHSDIQLLELWSATTPKSVAGHNFAQATHFPQSGLSQYTV